MECQQKNEKFNLFYLWNIVLYGDLLQQKKLYNYLIKNKKKIVQTDLIPLKTDTK